MACKSWSRHCYVQYSCPQPNRRLQMWQSQSARPGLAGNRPPAPPKARIRRSDHPLAVVGRKFLDFGDWSSHDWSYQDDGERNRILEVLHRFRKFFPKFPPTAIPGYKPWPKPSHYLASVCIMAGLSQLELHRRLATIYIRAFPESELPSEEY